ncbi:MAG: protease SohB [Pseudomonadota bacterium]
MISHPWLGLAFFFIKVIIIVIAIIVILAVFFSLLTRNKTKKKRGIQITRLNKHYDDQKQQLEQALCASKTELKQQKKAGKKKKKTKKQAKSKPHLFVLDFKGDIKAEAVDNFREEITMVLTKAQKTDEIFVRVESPGGLVHAYGLAASQLQRIRERDIPLTVAVDKVAASGGYMMACVANKIIAAPFAIIGSVGVLAQLPNFHRLLKKHDIDFEQITGGKYKRTLTLFGENTDQDRQKMQEEVNEIHQLFADFVKQQRPQIDIDRVATGEHWPAIQAKNLQLVDDIITSDDYLLNAAESHTIVHIETIVKQKLMAKLMGQARSELTQMNQWQWLK